jgi:ABC-type multidrug transport system fused ATPase/permease subunit
MKNGNIVESGHHNELIALNDVYGALVAKQKM